METAIRQFRQRISALPHLRKHSKQAFWLWIAYQTIKGTLTTALIWVPLILTYWNM